MRGRCVHVIMRARPAKRRRMELELDEQAGHHVVRFEHAVPSTMSSSNARREAFQFSMDRAYYAAVSQADLYAQSVSSLVESWIDGYNATIMAYGQTGAGKTYTMMGGTTFQDRGVCARAVGQAFAAMDAKRGEGYEAELRVSFVEIYNDSVYDLLAFDATEPRPLTVQEDEGGQLHVVGLAMPVVKTESRALEMLFEGETNRAVAENKLNSASSRSHCIFALHLATREVSGLGRSFSSVLNLVDLAGAERRHHTGAVAARQREASYVNRSLSALEQVVLALSDRHRSHIPFRSSTLTRMLHNSIGGNAKTLLIAAVWPRLDHAQHTISTLRFAQRMRRVKNVAKVNATLSGVGAIPASHAGDAAAWAQREHALRATYESELKLLREEIAMHDALSSSRQRSEVLGGGGAGDALPGAPLGAREMDALRATAKALAATDADACEEAVRAVELRSVRGIRALIWSLATLARESRESCVQRSVRIAPATARAAATPVAPAVRTAVVAPALPRAAAAAAPRHDLNPTGERDAEHGSSDALDAPDTPGPGAASAIMEGAPLTDAAADDADEGGYALGDGAEDPEAAAGAFAAGANWSAIGRDAAFREYKLSGDGLQIAQMQKDKKRTLRSQMERSKELVDSINDAKSSIDVGTGAVKVLRAALAEGVAEEAKASASTELVEARRALKDAKRDYRDLFNEREMLRSDMAYQKKLLNKSREELLKGFEGAWEAATAVVVSAAEQEYASLQSKRIS